MLHSGKVYFLLNPEAVIFLAARGALLLSHRNGSGEARDRGRWLRQKYGASGVGADANSTPTVGLESGSLFPRSR
jgi:hypothetical protein